MVAIKLSSLLSLVALVTSVVASPTDLAARQSIDMSSHCGQWDTVTAGSYTMFLDLWGASGATSGQQCSQLVSLSGSTISWKTTWTWVGGTGVKSFSNIQLNQGINKQLSAIKSMPVSPFFLPILHRHCLLISPHPLVDMELVPEYLG